MDAVIFRKTEKNCIDTMQQLMKGEQFLRSNKRKFKRLICRNALTATS